MKKTKEIVAGENTATLAVDRDDRQDRPTIETLCIGRGSIKGCTIPISCCKSCNPDRELLVERRSFSGMVADAEQLADHLRELQVIADDLADCSKNMNHTESPDKAIMAISTRCLRLACDLQFTRRPLFYNLLYDLLYDAMNRDLESF